MSSPESMGDLQMAGGEEILSHWRQHIGLIIGGVTSVLIVLKLLAVAGWNMTTAFGILSTAGTTNVLTGTLLAVLPSMYVCAYIWFMPRIETWLSSRTSVERTFARLLVTWMPTLLLFIVPLHLQVAVLFFYLLLSSRKVWRSIRFRASNKRRRARPGKETVSSFKATSASMGVAAMLSFVSLSTPWLPPQIIESDGKKETVYVLSISHEKANVLISGGRALRQIDLTELTGRYCQLGKRWLTEPFVTFLEDPPYEPCPIPNS